MSDSRKPHAFRATTTARESLLRVSITTNPRCSPLPSLPHHVLGLFLSHLVVCVNR